MVLLYQEWSEIVQFYCVELHKLDFILGGIYYNGAEFVADAGLYLWEDDFVGGVVLVGVTGMTIGARCFLMGAHNKYN